MTFSIKLANGKESRFEKASDLADWYHKEKRAALSVDDVKKKSKKKKENDKPEQNI